MKVVNFWKTLFCAALAVTAFSACSDDDEEGGYSGMPEITVNGGESVTVAGKLEGGKLEQTVEVVSKGDWTLTFKNPGDSQWVTPSAMSGKTGTTQLTFTLGQASGERSAILVLTASSKVEGFRLRTRLRSRLYRATAMFRRVTLFTARTAARRSRKSTTGLMWTSSKVGPAAVRSIRRPLLTPATALR